MILLNWISSSLLSLQSISSRFPPIRVLCSMWRKNSISLRELVLMISSKFWPFEMIISIRLREHEKVLSCSSIEVSMGLLMRVRYLRHAFILSWGGEMHLSLGISSHGIWPLYMSNNWSRFVWFLLRYQGRRSHLMGTRKSAWPGFLIEWAAGKWVGKPTCWPILIEGLPSDKVSLKRVLPSLKQLPSLLNFPIFSSLKIMASSIILNGNRWKPLLLLSRLHNSVKGVWE